MNNTVNVGVGLENLVESRLVGDIDLSELSLLAGDQLNATKSLGGGVVEVVRDDDLVTSLEESKGGERANVARPTVDCVVSPLSLWWGILSRSGRDILPSDKN